MISDLRCLISGHPCGTDTHPVGKFCDCANCQIYEELAALRDRAARAEAKVERMRDAILAVRAVDSGAWLKDCTTVLFNCGQGHEERMSLMRSLNQLYKALAEPED